MRLNFKLKNKIGIGIITCAALMLCACDVDDISSVLGIDAMSSEADDFNQPTINIEGSSANETVNTPVITINDGSDGVILNEILEEEPEYIYEEIFDPVEKHFSAKASENDEISLAFVGDVGFAEGYATINVYRQQANGIDDCFDPEVLDIMRGVDIMMANNEFPYSYRGTPTPNKTYTFRADPKDVVLMNQMGVDIVSLANNHAYDYGPDALLDTLDTLTGAKIAYVGAGKDMAEASHPAYFHINDKIISYVSATQIERYGNPDTKEATADSPGVLRTLEPSKTVEAIKVAEENSDFTVVYVHWGTESTDLVEQSQRDLAKAYVDAGADLIIGDHSHCLQGIDYVGGVPVFYSLGNFWFNSKTLDTCIIKVLLDADCKIKDLEFIPCIQTGSKVRIGNGDNYDRILEYMRGISNYALIDEEGKVSEDSENHNIQNGQNTSPARKPATTENNEQATEGEIKIPEANDFPDWAVPVE